MDAPAAAPSTPAAPGEATAAAETVAPLAPAADAGAASSAAAAEAGAPPPPTPPSRQVSLEELRGRMAAFVAERDWHQYHTPRNLLLALVGEVGELAEVMQWRGEVARGLPGWAADDLRKVGDELADVQLYLVRLADVCGVDLGRAVLRKLEVNARKYPPGASRGRAAKYTAYVTSPQAMAAIEAEADAAVARELDGGGGDGGAPAVAGAASASKLLLQPAVAVVPQPATPPAPRPPAAAARRSMIAVVDEIAECVMKASGALLVCGISVSAVAAGTIGLIALAREVARS
jgi:dCTP diphosphatase